MIKQTRSNHALKRNLKQNVTQQNNFRINQQKYQLNLKDKEKKSNYLKKLSLTFIEENESNLNKKDKHIQNLFKKLKNLVQKKQINQAISLSIHLLEQNYQNITQPKSYRNRTISLSPSKILQKNTISQTESGLLDIFYILANCYLAKKDFRNGFKYLQKIKLINPQFSNNLSLLIALSLFNLQEYEKSFQHIQAFLNDYFRKQKICTNDQKQQTQQVQANKLQCQNRAILIDYLFLKSRILIKLSRFTQSEEILKQILTLCPNHVSSINLLIQLLKRTKKYEQAILIIKKFQLQCQNQEQMKKLQINKIQFQYLNQNYTDALQCFESLQKSSNIKQSKFSYLKGKICKKLNISQKCILYFNETLDLNNNHLFTRLALCQLIIYYLKQRDFYQAQSYCKRYSFISQDKNLLIQSLSQLAQSLILLMKRNFQQGLKKLQTILFDNLQQLKQKQDVLFLQNLFYNGLAFSYFCLGKHAQALQNYRKMVLNQYQQEYYPCQYNMKLCQGIIHIRQNLNQQKAIECFETSIDYLLRPEPYFYISVILTQKNLKYDGSSQIFMKILSILQSGLNINPTCQMHFYRSLVYMYLGMNIQALQDIDKAIEISQDNIVEHFYAKGLIYFIQQNYEQAISQFEVAISINQKYQKLFLQKAKCQILSGNTDQAYADLQTYQTLKNNQPRQSIWYYYFMLYQRRFQQIIDITALELQDQNQQYKEEIIDIQNTCNFFLGRFQLSGAAGKLVLALIYQSFEELQKIINQALQIRVNVGCLSQIDLKFIRAYVLFRINRYHQAIESYQQLQNILILNEKQLATQHIELFVLFIKINTIICHYANEDNQKCKQKLVKLIDQIHQGQLSDQLKQLLMVVQENDNDQQICLDNPDKPFAISLFLDKELLSSFLSIQKVKKLTFKIFIPFPILEINQLKPNRQKMLQQFQFSKIQNRPQAPWIKRGQFGVLFTNQIRQFNNLHLNTEQTQTNSKQKIIDDLRLGSQVLLKLQKIREQFK